MAQTIRAKSLDQVQKLLDKINTQKNTRNSVEC